MEGCLSSLPLTEGLPLGVTLTGLFLTVALVSDCVDSLDVVVEGDLERGLLPSKEQGDAMAPSTGPPTNTD